LKLIQNNKKNRVIIEREKGNMRRKIMGIFVCMLILIVIVLPAEGTIYTHLPPPGSTSMILEETLWRRSSIRNFTSEPVSIEDLSTILWAAYGVRGDGSRTVAPVNGLYAVRIYVLQEDAVYYYEASNHSLVFYKSGDYRSVSAYPSPVVIGIVWNDSLNPDGDVSTLEVGAVGQNIQLMANALDLGCVPTGDFPPYQTLMRIGLPEHETGRIIIPLGHPLYPYDFHYFPFWISSLPKIQKSSMSLSDALKARNETDNFSGELPQTMQIQMLWSAYGYSYFVDKSEFSFNYHISRHRTVPSAHKYYPLQVYGITATGAYQYIPNIYDVIKFIFFLPEFPFPIVTYTKKIINVDMRSTIANATANPSCAKAPFLLIIVLDVNRTRPPGNADFSGPEFRWLWYYEVGAAAHNVQLEAAAWNLTVNSYVPNDSETIRSALVLTSDFIPCLIIAIGR
jgi:nitroreductase